jgi:hypothetical protein
MPTELDYERAMRKAILGDPKLAAASMRHIIEGSVQHGPGKPVKEPVKVFRIEMPNGNGPYNSGLPNAKEIYERLCLPEPYGFFCVRNAIMNCEDMNTSANAFRSTHGHAHYGCDSIKSLHDWFPEGAREYLADYDARTVEYEIPVGEYMLEMGSGEIVFNRYACRVVGEHSVYEKELACAA